MVAIGPPAVGHGTVCHMGSSASEWHTDSSCSMQGLAVTGSPLHHGRTLSWSPPGSPLNFIFLIIYLRGTFRLLYCLGLLQIKMLLNNHVQVLMWTYIFISLNKCPGVQLLGAMSKYMFSFTRNCQSMFKNN